MIGKITKGVALLFCLSFLLPVFANADGIYTPPPDLYVTSTKQKAVITYEKGMETLILSTQFLGNAKDFGWVVPVPSRPEVSKSSDELFTSLESLTAPKYYKTTRGLSALMTLEEAEEEPVKVLETKRVGIYEIKVLEANDPKALANWLSENKYMYPKEGSYILDEYIQKKWYFVAAKIDTQALLVLSETEALKEGHAQPIKLVFKSDKIIYPLKISSLQGSLAKKMVEEKEKIPPEYHDYYPWRDVSISLYVFADGKKELPGFSTDYANFLSPKTIKKLAYVEGESWWQPDHKFYLTRLSRSMTFSEMTEDLILRPADNNIPVNTEKTTLDKVLTATLAFFIGFLIWVLSSVGLLFIIFNFVRKSTKSKMIYGISIIVQWVTFICTVIGYIVYLLVIGADGFFERISEFEEVDMDNWGGLVFGLIAIVIMLVILLKQRARYSKIKDNLK